MEQNNNTEQFNLEKFNSFALNVNGNYVKMYLTSSMQTVHFLRNSGALVLYYSINSDDQLNTDMFQLYLNDILLFSGKGFNENIRQQLYKICNEYENRISNVETNYALQKVVDEKVSINRGDITNTEVLVETKVETGEFLRSLLSRLKELESKLAKIQNENKNISLNYKIKKILISYTRYIGVYNDVNISITDKNVEDKELINNSPLDYITNNGSYLQLNSVSPIETLEYKVGEKNMLPEGSRILNVEITLEILNVYTQTSTHIALVTDFNTKTIVGDDKLLEGSKLEIFFHDLRKGNELIETSEITFNINYIQQRNNTTKTINVGDGFIVENGRNILLNKIFYVEDVTTSSHNIVSSLETSIDSISSELQNNTQNELYNIYSLINDELEIYGYQEIYYNHGIDNILYNDMYNYLGTKANLTNKPYNGMQIAKIDPENNYVELKLKCNIQSDNNSGQNVISNINNQLLFTPFSIETQEDKTYLKINQLLLCIPAEYSIDDITLHIIENDYDISTHTKLMYVINNMPNYFCLKYYGNELTFNNIMNKNKYKIYCIYDVFINLSNYIDKVGGSQALLKQNLSNTNYLYYIFDSTEFLDNTYLKLKYSKCEFSYNEYNDDLKISNGANYAIAPNFEKISDITEITSSSTYNGKRLPTNAMYTGANNFEDIFDNDGAIDYRTIINNKISNQWIICNNFNEAEEILNVLA